MNKTSIKNYAIWARNELISRVSQKAFEYGVEKDNTLPYDAQSINGRLLTDDEKKKRQILINEVKHKGYDQVIEEVAYTWFNRFIALRFMEVNNYLLDKVRLFTNDNNEFKPQIIDEALHIELAGLDKNKIITLKEANNNEELYKELLLATCNDMSRYLPGMFKPIDDYMTLLFPSNLLREESVLGRLISDIDEDSWTDQVQIIGWLYQYYNTELKDKTFTDLKKNIKIAKEKVPSATQLFTPDWIVRYMTENSLGRLWLNGHPNAEIKSNWEYYLDEAEQEESVKIELNKIKAEHAKLRPEDIKFLDPCMGSGHILVYAFDVFMQIYVSEGWTEREAAKSILQNNIYGLDIDERAYQLSYFALMMKARQYNRRILSEGIVPNVMAIEESNTFNKELLRRFGDLKPLAEKILNAFVDAKEYGSILNVEFSKEELDSLEERINEIDKMSDYGNLLDQMESDQLLCEFYPLLKQARIMSQRYECVVTNPPYMGNGNMSHKLNEYTKNNYPDSKNDLCTVMVEHGFDYLKTYGYEAMITMESWMFLSSFEKVRNNIIGSKTITSLIHMPYLGKGGTSLGINFGTEMSVLLNKMIRNHVGKYNRIVYYETDSEGIPFEFPVKNEYLVSIDQTKFTFIPGSPIAYWASPKILEAFAKGQLVGSLADVKIGMGTGKNEVFVRNWWEVENNKIDFSLQNINQLDKCNAKYFPYNKGGKYRLWYGNLQEVVWFDLEGRKKMNEMAGHRENGGHDFYFRHGITWTFISSSRFGVRALPYGFLFDVAGSTLFTTDENLYYLLGFLSSSVCNEILKLLNPTMNYQAGNIKSLPVLFGHREEVNQLVNQNINLSKDDWDSFEISWDFKHHPLISHNKKISDSYSKWGNAVNERFSKLKNNEETINKLFVDTYNAGDTIGYSVNDNEVTIHAEDMKRDIKGLISYSVGCMFGRYSLDVDGLAYAGGEWDDSKFKSFIPDKDNIIPICSDEYFDDDIVGKFIEFIKTVFGEDTLEENLRFIAETLGGEGTSRKVIRNYFMSDFYNDHLKVYQKRPIYWQFDSGKKNGFKALIYIHRYTPDLIARMRTSYVHEQQSRYENQMSMIQNRIDSAASTSERVKAEKEMKKLKDQADELRVYEEKIHHWADKMEPMDLDDGVKANYAKFQELLTKIK